MTNETIIGLYYYVDDCEFVTFEQLKRHCENPNCKYTLKQYLDRRVSTNITHFNFDPWTGEKIDWSKLKKSIKS